MNSILASGATSADRSLVEASAAIYGPAVPQPPKISLIGMERDATLYPAHPTAPDFTRVKAADYVAPKFAEDAGTLPKICFCVPPPPGKPGSEPIVFRVLNGVGYLQGAWADREQARQGWVSVTSIHLTRGPGSYFLALLLSSL